MNNKIDGLNQKIKNANKAMKNAQTRKERLENELSNELVKEIGKFKKGEKVFFKSPYNSNISIGRIEDLRIDDNTVRLREIDETANYVMARDVDIRNLIKYNTVNGQTLYLKRLMRQKASLEYRIKDCIKGKNNYEKEIKKAEKMLKKLKGENG